MRLVTVYLSVYYLLIAGALIALWYGDALGRLSPLWVIAGLLVAVGLGILLYFTSATPIVRD
jgi:hypothetical protein